MLDPLEVDTDGDVGRLVTHVAAVTDLDHDGVEVDHRIQRLQRTLLPGEDLLSDGVDDLRDRLMGQLGADRRGEVMADVTDRHAAGVERHDDRVEPVETAGPLRHKHRRERPLTITGHGQLDVADLAGHRLGEAAVA